MKIVLQHATGNANVRAATLGLNQAGLLAGFETAIACFPGDILDRMSSFKPFSLFRRRSYDSSLKPYTKIWPWKEIGRLAALKLGLENLVEHESGLFSIDAVLKDIDKHVASSLKKVVSKGVTSVYAYEDGALDTFREAKHLGLHCLYDLPIGYWRRARQLLEIEKEKWPDWEMTLTGLRDSSAKLSRKDKELELADDIFVASSFTAETLNDFPGSLKDVHIVPYGFPAVSNKKKFAGLSRRRLKLLFVGGLSQRKGIANLFAAVESLKDHIELTVVGLKLPVKCPALDTALSKHRWIPTLPHHEILNLMLENDVLVFPSLFEGFGLVISEAMSQGTAVITTNRTAGPDLIEDGHNGWLIDAGSTDALQATIENLLHNPGLIPKAGRAAMQTAIKRPWNVYGKELAEAIVKSQIF